MYPIYTYAFNLQPIIIPVRNPIVVNQYLYIVDPNCLNTKNINSLVPSFFFQMR